MREHPTENEVTKEWLDGDNLFYRKTDKPHYLKAISALENEDKSLIVIGDEGVLDHYCRILISRLKDNPLFKLEVFLSTSKDGLLKRFNQMLSNLSIDEARQPPNANSAVQLLVINDAGAIKDQEWALLTRLIRDFPGANVRCAMFVDKSSSLELEAKIEKLGRKVHKWLVHAPTLDEVSELKSAGSALGMKLEVEKLLKLAGLHEDKKIEIRESIESEEIIDIENEVSLNISSTEVSPNEASNLKETNDKSSRKTDSRPRRHNYFLSLLLLLVISFGLMNFLYPDRLESVILKVESKYEYIQTLLNNQAIIDENEIVEMESPTLETTDYNTLSLELDELDDSVEIILTGDQFLNDTDYLIEELENTTIIIFPTYSISTGSLKTVKDIEHPNIDFIDFKKEDDVTKLYVEYIIKQSYQIFKTQNKLTLRFEKPTVEAPERDDANSDENLVNDVVEQVSSEDASLEEVATDSEDEQTYQEISEAIQNEENEILRSSVEIVQSAPDSSVFLQHIVFADINQAITYIQSYNGLEAALVVPISSGNRELVAVLSGPFVDSQTAENWSKSFGFGADYWIRSAGSLKNALVSELLN